MHNEMKPKKAQIQEKDNIWLEIAPQRRIYQAKTEL